MADEVICNFITVNTYKVVMFLIAGNQGRRSYQGSHLKIAMVGEAFRAIENISACPEFKMHALKNCLLKNAFFFGPSLGPPALALARRP